MHARYRQTVTALEEAEIAAQLVIPRKRAAVPKNRLDDKGAQMALRQLTLPWAGLFYAVERAANPDVALLQLQPEPQRRILRITAEARHRDAMFMYLRALAKAQELTRVHLVSDEVVTDDPLKPVRFSVQASFGARP